MKYSFTTRLINTIITLILFAGFAFVGIYFGFVVGPFLWTGVQPAGVDLPKISLGLAGMLGSAGFAGMIITGYGLACSVLSILKGNDDGLVKKAFCSYVSVGILLAVFFLLNACWLFRLTSTNLGDDDIGFIITVYVIAFLVAIIGSNVPLNKLFGEGEDSNGIMKVITGTMFAINFGVALAFGLQGLVTKPADIAYADIIFTKTGIVALACLVAAALNVLAFLGYSKAAKAGTYKKANGLAFETSLLINGLTFVGAGLLCYFYREKAAWIMASQVWTSAYSHYEEFYILSYIVGGVVTFASLILMYYTIKPGKSKIVRG